MQHSRHRSPGARTTDALRCARALTRLWAVRVGEAPPGGRVRNTDTQRQTTLNKTRGRHQLVRKTQDLAPSAARVACRTAAAANSRPAPHSPARTGAQSPPDLRCWPAPYPGASVSRAKASHSAEGCFERRSAGSGRTAMTGDHPATPGHPPSR